MMVPGGVKSRTNMSDLGMALAELLAQEDFVQLLSCDYAVLNKR